MSFKFLKLSAKGLPILVVCSWVWGQLMIFQQCLYTFLVCGFYTVGRFHSAFQFSLGFSPCFGFPPTLFYLK